MTTQDQALSNTVDRNAYDRVTKDNAELKALLATAQGELSTVALERRAYDYFTEQKAPDAVALSRLAAPHLTDVDPTAIGEKLGALFPASMLATAPAPATETPPAEPDTPAAPAVPPVPAIGGPDPAAPGTAPAAKRVKINSPEMKARIAKEGWGAVGAAVAANEVTFDPSNEHAQRLTERA